MSIAWFLCRLERIANYAHAKVGLAPSLMPYKIKAKAEGGNLAWQEVLNGYVLVKVRAGDTLLSEMEGVSGVTRLGETGLTDSLNDLTDEKYIKLKSILRDSMGYTNQQIKDLLGENKSDWTTKNFKDLLKMMASRRKKPIYTEATDSVAWTGDEVDVDPEEIIVFLDKKVTNGNADVSSTR